MIRFYPDKPHECGPADIPSWDSGDYICQQKIDGWRALIFIDDDVRIISRHNKDLTDEIDPDLMAQVEALKKVFPSKTIIDAEWLSRRACSNKRSMKQRLFVFDLMRHGRKWIKRQPYKERLQTLSDGLDALDLDRVLLPAHAEEGSFTAFYEEQKSIPISEGIVVKHKESTIVGDRKECKKNPRWFKVRYRGGSDGEMDMSHLRKGNR
jgi:ATP-dependent DNA ligase